MIQPSAFIAHGAIVLGDVHLGDDASIWYNAVVRGDAERIEIGDETNIQDLSLVHADPGVPCVVGRRVTVGHRAILHGCTVEDECLIGMGAILLNGVRVGTGSVIGAGAVLAEGAVVPPGSLVLGVPGKVIRRVDAAMRDRIDHAHRHYTSPRLAVIGPGRSRSPRPRIPAERMPPPAAALPGDGPMVPLVYHPRDNITAFGLERLHPFDGRKYRRIHDALIARGLRRPGEFIRPRPADRPTLLRLHAPDYLRTLRRPSPLAAILEVPPARRLPAWVLDWRILRPMRYAAGGTLLACRLVLESGLAINLGGGFHHASADQGGGFCAYVPLAALILHEERRFGRVLVVDLDAHQGDGTASAFRGWPWAAILDLNERDIFPFPKQPEDYPIPVGPGLSGGEYLRIVRDTLPAALDAVRPDLVVYNAGSDPYQGDPLAMYRLTRDDLAERDLLVVDMVRDRGIPAAMVLSGGYSAESWRIHADAIEGLLTRFDRR